jgi:hypothetical protein
MSRIVRFLVLLAITIPVVATAQQQLRVAFITKNAYGNNLYLDNVTLGHRFAHDVGVVTISNIPPDTSYVIGTVIAPVVCAVNYGTSAAGSPFTVTLRATPGGYTSSRTVASLAPGAMVHLVMDTLTITGATPKTFTLFSNAGVDENRSNDTLTQTSLMLPGVRRTVLLEEWTSSTCGPCAANNPTVDAFIAAKGDSIVSVKYHVGWPSPGNDPMYLYNTAQSYDRRYYYGVTTVPHVIMDGLVTPEYPYTTPSSLPDAFSLRRPAGAPVSITVRDSLLPGDSLEARVTVVVHAPLRDGSYRLRVHAVERHIVYPAPPGTNGEQEFYDVFRGSHPQSAGTVLSPSPGTYTFSYRYRQAAPAIRDSLYTIAYVQNDFTKEVLNAGKSIAIARFVQGGPVTRREPGTRERCISGDALPEIASLHVAGAVTAGAGFHDELFERGFPPAGWRLGNPDGSTTLERYPGVNGPTYGGDVSTRIDFYNYSSIGQTDTLYSSVVTGLLPNDSLIFDWAHAQYPGYNDRLIVKISTNGGATYDSTVFDRAGSLLATAPATSNAFIPLGSQWKTFGYPLSGLVIAAPNPPLLAYPGQGANGLSVTPRLIWHAGTGNVTYRLQVASDSGFSVTVYSDSTITDTAKTVPPLPAGSVLFWRVSAKNAGGNGPWSEVRHFMTAAFVTSAYPVTGNWNLIGVPLTVADPRKSSLFPSAISDAYMFDATAGYVRRDTLMNGRGYWLKFPGVGSVSFSGYERLADTLVIAAGWNLIGPISRPVPVVAIQQSPPGLLVSSLYGFGTGYEIADTLRPAQGYWVKAGGPGRIVLIPPGPVGRTSR